MCPTREQEVLLAEHCAHARFVWNFAVEQLGYWHHRQRLPNYVEQSRQLTEARAAYEWLGAGSQTVQQINRRWSRVLVPKVGWVRLRRTRVLADWKSYRVTLDASGRWHIAFAVIPARLDGPGDGSVVDFVEKTSTIIARRYDVIRIEDLRVANMVRSARGTVEQPGRNVRQKAGLNRSILNAAWAAFATRLEYKAAGRVERVNPAVTSQRCSVCGYVAAESRKSQALFRCVACTYTANADVNAARNIAAGRAVTARGGLALAEPVNREPQHKTSLVT